MDLYNSWAKNKVLAKDVIIHTHAMIGASNVPSQLMIMVFFDERIHPEWTQTLHERGIIP